jgi:histone acetyltransferase 1
MNATEADEPMGMLNNVFNVPILKKPKVDTAQASASAEDEDDILAKYKLEASECVNIQLVTDAQQVKLKSSEYTFRPVYTHQIFREDESIFGYGRIDIQMFFAARDLYLYWTASLEDKIEEASGLEVDDPVQQLQDQLHEDVLEMGQTQDRQQFEAHLRDTKNAAIPGEKVASITVASGKVYEVYTGRMEDEAVRQLHARAQIFALFFIDGASYIDDEDGEWIVYFVFEKRNDGSMLFAGYVTVYEYYAHPFQKRGRISQFVLLPPQQKSGLGTKLLAAIYQHGIETYGFVDFTVEDPSEGFQAVRDRLDGARMLQAWRQEVAEGKGKEKQRASGTEGMTNSPATWERFKALALQQHINRIQTRRLYEILLRYHAEEEGDAAMRDYRLAIKMRLYARMQNEGEQLPADKRKARLQELFEILDTEYAAAVASLKAKEK